LFACLRHLLGSRSDGTEFVYAETHAGRPEYVLPQGGEWQSGIGKLSKTVAMKDDRRLRKDGQSTQLGFVGQFDETFVGRELKTAMRYPGSTAVAFRVLRSADRLFTMRLWETDGAASDDLERYYLPWKDKIHVNCSDGYAGVPRCNPLTLALIDPPKLDTELVISTLKHLTSRGTSYVAWVPRTSRANWTPNAGQFAPPEEADTSRRFHELACQVGVCFGVQWHAWGARTPGCWIAASNDLRDVAWVTIECIVKLMDDRWSATATLGR
jgi:23S rRNA A2030 N6-methylase RlmJ